jgi:hypothetical protein
MIAFIAGEYLYYLYNIPRSSTKEEIHHCTEAIQYSNESSLLPIFRVQIAQLLWSIVFKKYNIFFKIT